MSHYTRPWNLIYYHPDNNNSSMVVTIKTCFQIGAKIQTHHWNTTTVNEMNRKQLPGSESLSGKILFSKLLDLLKPRKQEDHKDLKVKWRIKGENLWSRHTRRVVRPSEVTWTQFQMHSHSFLFGICTSLLIFLCSQIHCPTRTDIYFWMMQIHN